MYTGLYIIVSVNVSGNSFSQGGSSLNVLSEESSKQLFVSEKLKLKLVPAYLHVIIITVMPFDQEP